MKECPELKSKFEEHVQEAVKYASTIEDFDELVDPRTLTRHCLGPEPSHYILRAIHQEERKRELSWYWKMDRLFFLSLLFLILTLFFLFAEMTTKFNQGLYAKIKTKKNKPLSNISTRRLRVMEKEKEKEMMEKGSSTPTLDERRAASPGVSIEEAIPRTKKRKTRDKGKEKVRASIKADVGMAMARAKEVVTPKKLKEISNVPSHEMVNHHVHKLVQVAFHLSYCFFFLLSLTVDCFSQS